MTVVDFEALQQWADTGRVTRRRRRERSIRKRHNLVGKWRHSISSTSSWNPPSPIESIEEEFNEKEIGNGRLLAQMLAQENDDIWNNPDYRFTFYSPNTGTVRATDVVSLKTDNVQGLDELIGQAMGKEPKGEKTVADNANTNVNDTPSPVLPQLSVTAAADDDEEKEDCNIENGQDGKDGADNSKYLHPAYTRGKKPSAASKNKKKGTTRLQTKRVAEEKARVFWLDIARPSDTEILALSKVFDLHPLTTDELLLMRDVGDAVQDSHKSFRNYDIICYHTTIAALPTEEERKTVDDELQIPFYIIALANGVLTLHGSSLVPHVRNTISRLMVDEELVRVTPEYVAYLLLDDITDTLVPIVRLLELEVDAIDELVLILTKAEHDDVLKRIGIERRHALWLVRLLHGKAEALRAVERRTQSKINGGSPQCFGTQSSFIAHGNEDDDDDNDDGLGSASESQMLTSDEEEGELYGRLPSRNNYHHYHSQIVRDKSLPDVIKYLADVHDHLMALTASVHHCERILARAHGNYLARINLELTHASNTTNQLATQMTVLAGIFLPLNLVAGIFGMNVKVPGKDRDDLRDFGIILGAMAAFVVFALAVCRWRKII